jgi:uncharacterized protein (DUF433 family)
MNWQDYIVVDPAVCHGKACIKGTRIMISVVLDNLKEKSQCPECHTFWAREDLDQELMGIFQKSTFAVRMAFTK